MATTSPGFHVELDVEVERAEAQARSSLTGSRHDRLSRPVVPAEPTVTQPDQHGEGDRDQHKLSTIASSGLISSAR